MAWPWIPERLSAGKSGGVWSLDGVHRGTNYYHTAEAARLANDR